MIEKMKFISVIGPKDQLDTVTRQYLCRYEIQLENAMGELKHLNNITPNAELNPYREAAGRAAEIAALYGSKAAAVRDMDVNAAMERNEVNAPDIILRLLAFFKNRAGIVVCVGF